MKKKTEKKRKENTIQYDNMKCTIDKDEKLMKLEENQIGELDRTIDLSIQTKIITLRMTITISKNCYYKC